MIFKDRETAGKRLARQLKNYRERDDVLVVALPRGGVAVGYEVAAALNVPLETFIVRKIGVPGDPELAAGAIAENGDVFVDPDMIEQYIIHPMYLERCIRQKREEIKRLQEVYRLGRPMRSLKDYVIIVVDDGIATGATIKTALRAIRKEGAKKLILAVPVAPLDSIDDFKGYADEMIVLSKPFPFFSVGSYYSSFDQVSDEAVNEFLQFSPVGAGRG